MRPHPVSRPNTWAFLTEPMVAPSGFREYDARWRYPEEINLSGMEAVGLGLGTELREAGGSAIVVASDYREYAPAVKQALILGLMQAGVAVTDIGTALTPLTAFASFRLGIPAVAMVTASHNPNGWTGVKTGFAMPLTHGPEEMARLRDRVLLGHGRPAPGGSLTRAPDLREGWLADLAGDFRLTRPLRVVCACGNGTAAAFAPDLLARLGAEVVPLHCEPDWTFPHYNPNPEALAMLRDMGRAVRAAGADLALGFDGDGDRLGVTDEKGREIFADRLGLLLARRLAARHQGAHFVIDVKSTGLFRTDPELARLGATTEIWRTGHSHMKRRIAATGALAGFEKSGHCFFAPPVGRGYDCALTAAVEVLKLLDAEPGTSLGRLADGLAPSFMTPTLSPPCPEAEKYAVAERIGARLARLAAAGGTLGGRRIERLLTVNGVRAELAGGGFALVRASSNTPNLVVVCESLTGEAELGAILADIGALVGEEPSVGPWDQNFRADLTPPA
jgi:phosphomannomutase/phosphoglucomutase